MIPNNSLVNSHLAVAKIQKSAKLTARMSRILGTALTSGLLLSFICPFPSIAENVSAVTVKEKTTELTQKCQQKYGLNSENPNKAALKECLARVLRACTIHTNGNAELCKQWIKKA